MRSRRPLLMLSLAALLGGCATTGTLGPDGIARLERAQAAHPQSASDNRSLGIAYFQANRFPEARQALQKAAALDPKDGTTQLFLGMTAESQNDLVAARTAYSSYVQYGRTGRLRRQLEDRLAALNQKELIVKAKADVANEANLASVPGSPTTIAVMPLQFSGSDTTLIPLGRGLTDLLTTDLARSPELTIVERARMQALLDEIKLQQSGATDSGSDVRAGKMLQAGRIIAGGVTQTGQEIRVDAPIVNVSDAQVVATPSDSRTLDQLFTLETNLAFNIFTSLNVTLTTAQHDAIEQRPTKSLAAFLAYGRGLTFMDEGRFDDASQFFDQAVRIDPGFSAAATKAQQSQAAAQGQQVTTTTIQSGLHGTVEGRIADGASQGVVVTAANDGLASTIQTMASSLNPSTAGVATTGGGTTTTAQTPTKDNPAATGTGTDNVGVKIGTIAITIHFPHP